MVYLEIEVQPGVGLVSKVQCSLPGNQGTTWSIWLPRYSVVYLKIKVQCSLPGNQGTTWSIWLPRYSVVYLKIKVQCGLPGN